MAAPQTLRARLEAVNWRGPAPRRPTADNAASDRLKAAVGAALGRGYVPTLEGDCPGLAFLRCIDDETASAADVEAFEAIAAVAYFPGRSFTTADYLLAVARRGRSPP